MFCLFVRLIVSVWPAGFFVWLADWFAGGGMVAGWLAGLLTGWLIVCLLAGVLACVRACLLGYKVLRLDRVVGLRLLVSWFAGRWVCLVC